MMVCSGLKASRSWQEAAAEEAPQPASKDQARGLHVQHG